MGVGVWEPSGPSPLLSSSGGGGSGGLAGTPAPVAEARVAEAGGGARARPPAFGVTMAAQT